MFFVWQLVVAQSWQCDDSLLFLQWLCHSLSNISGKSGQQCMQFSKTDKFDVQSTVILSQADITVCMYEMWDALVMLWYACLVWSKSSISSSHSCSSEAITWPCWIIQSSSRIPLYKTGGMCCSFFYLFIYYINCSHSTEKKEKEETDRQERAVNM